MGTNSSSLLDYKTTIQQNILAKDNDVTIYEPNSKLTMSEVKKEKVQQCLFLRDCFIGNPIYSDVKEIDPLIMWVVNSETLLTRSNSMEELHNNLNRTSSYLMRLMNLPIFQKGIVLQVHSVDNPTELVGIATLVPPNVHTIPTISLLLSFVRNGFIPNSRFIELGRMDDARLKYEKQCKGFWYLQTIGTSTAGRGKGYGGKLLRTICSIGDYYHRCIYLETESESNERLYQKYRFETVETIVLGKTGTQQLTMYCMLRKPQVN